MNRRVIYGSFLVFFAVLAAISASYVYVSYQPSTPSTQLTTIGSYQQTASDYYLANLNYNYFYDNQTVITSNEPGLLYANLVNFLTVDFNYSFNSYPSATAVNTQSNIFGSITTASLTKQLTSAEMSSLLNLTNDPNDPDFTLQINFTTVQNYVNTLAGETGTTASDYSIILQPEIYVNASTSAGEIYSILEPTLEIATNHDDNGYYYTVTLENASSGGYLTTTTQVTPPQNHAMQSETLVSTVLLLALTALASGLFIRNNGFSSSEKKPNINKLIGPYKDLLIETKQLPPDTKSTVDMQALADLAKTAEILAKPIMYTVTPDSHLFYLIDGEVKYVYRFDGTQ